MDKNNQHTKKLPGFYIAVCCCVIAIGVAGTILNNTSEEEVSSTTHSEEQANEPQLAFDIQATAEPIELTPEPALSTAAPSVEPTSQPEDDYEFNNPDTVSAAVIVNAEESCDFVAPLTEMSILYGFSGDTLMYNEVYEDWRTHNGIDIEAPVGCSVCAAADGTVSDVKDGIFGKTVEIEHNNGFKSVYAQLGEINVAAGDNVTQGSVIGTVGESKGENITAPHLHYELHKDNKPQNPEEY